MSPNQRTANLAIEKPLNTLWFAIRKPMIFKADFWQPQMF
jgi:hypothetical protein